MSVPKAPSPVSGSICGMFATYCMFGLVTMASTGGMSFCAVAAGVPATTDAASAAAPRAATTVRRRQSLRVQLTTRTPLVKEGTFSMGAPDSYQPAPLGGCFHQFLPGMVVPMTLRRMGCGLIAVLALGGLAACTSTAPEQTERPPVIVPGGPGESASTLASGQP